jgi:hypothetical protein
LAETLIKHRDVTGVLVHFSQEQIEALMESMPPDQRALAFVLMETIKQPHEIWQAWKRDEAISGQWNNVRSYLQFFDLSQTNTVVPFCAAIVQFVVERSRWELSRVGIVPGSLESVQNRLTDIRNGRLEYSIDQH